MLRALLSRMDGQSDQGCPWGVGVLVRVDADGDLDRLDRPAEL
jgi:hypothetical protein